MVTAETRKVKCKYVPRVWVPGEFNPVEHLPARLWPAADSARWFLGTVIRRGMYGHGDGEGFVRLSSRILRDTIGRRTWPTLLDALRPHLETTQYVNGVRCRGYRLTDFEQDARRVPLRQPELVERLAARRGEWEREQEARLLPIHRRLRAIQRRHLTVAPEIDAAVAELPRQARLVQGALVRAIRERKAGFSVGGTGRVFNGLTGLKRGLRQYVRLAGEPIVGVDICCCQPALLGIPCFPPNGLKGAPTYSMLPAACASAVRGCGRGGRDAAEFVDLACSGQLYSRLLSECERWDVRLPADDPEKPASEQHKARLKWIKRRVLIDCLNFRAGDGPRPVSRMFRGLWPSVFRVIEWANCRERVLIGLLQRAESWLMFEHIAPRLAWRVPIVSVHDSLFCRVGDKAAVRAAFEETFAELGLSLQVKED